MGRGLCYLAMSLAGVVILSLELGSWPTVGVTLLVLGWAAWKGSRR